MNWFSWRKVAAVSAVMFATAANAGPFGVTMGQPLASLSPKPFPVAATGFNLVTVPQPNSEFERYTVISTPQTGVCKIWGTGRDYENDAYGNSVRSGYERLKSILESKYGPSKEFSFIRPGALWDKSSEWVMSIKQKERMETAFWGDNGQKLPDNLVSISIEVKATSRDSAYINLTYEFSNFERCQTIIKAKTAEGL